MVMTAESADYLDINVLHGDGASAGDDVPYPPWITLLPE
jgi:hypothetical protein